MNNIYVDVSGLEIKDLFSAEDFVSVEELIDIFTGIYLDNKIKDEEIEELRDFKNEYIENNPYSYYGVNEKEFH